MKWDSIFFSAFLILILSGCGPVCGRHYSIVLLDKAGLETIKTGKIESRNVFQYKDISTSYELHREKYTLKFEPTDYPAALKISSTDKKLSLNASSPSLTDVNVECYSIFSSNPRNDSSEISFHLKQNKNCANKEIEVEIKDSSGALIGRETLPFKIIEDGFYCYIDGI